MKPQRSQGSRDPAAGDANVVSTLGELLAPVAMSRVHRSFGFLDVCDFSAYNDLCGDAKAAQLLQSLRGVVRAAASRHGIRVDKWLGDGAMLVALDMPTLLAAMCEVVGVCAALGLPLAVRGGASCGPVLVLDGDDYCGLAINMASRLCDLAPPGRIATNTEHASILPVGATVTSKRERKIQGFSEPTQIIVLAPAIPAGNSSALLNTAMGALVEALVVTPTRVARTLRRRSAS